jgi:hypothetical protein
MGLSTGTHRRKPEQDTYYYEDEHKHSAHKCVQAYADGLFHENTIQISLFAVNIFVINSSEFEVDSSECKKPVFHLRKPFIGRIRK